MSRCLNLLRVITWLPVGGIERKIVAVLPRLDPGRFRPRVVCIRERGPLAAELEQLGVPVHTIPFGSRLSPSGILALARLMREERIDIVHAHMYRSAVPATIAARLAGVPVVITQVHNVGTWETRRQRWMDRFLCRWRSAIVGVSERVREDIIRNLGVAPEMTRVIYNGAEIERFADTALRAPTRRALGIPDEAVVVCYHGRLVDQKNPDALVDLARRFRDAGELRALVLVAGDGPRRAELEKRAASLGLGPSAIRFLGQREDIPEILQASDISVLPSAKEGFSNAVIEALAAGLPVVASDVGGNAEAVIDGESGFIVSAGDGEALWERVHRLVGDGALRARMRDAAALRGEAFSLDGMVKQVESLYDSLAKEKGI